MDVQIKALKKKNETYFQGMELEFNNRASFFQCIADPDSGRAGGFIAVQQKKRPKIEGCLQKIC